MEKRTKKHYVAYMDILGYKDSLKNKPEASELYLETILKCIKRVTETPFYFKKVSEQFDIEGELNLKIFSDNIMLSLEVGQGESEIRRAIVFLIMVASIQRGFVLEHGLLLRGGITLGDLFVNQDFVFGQGLVDAVELEQKTEFPCISISDELDKYLSGLTQDVTRQYERLLKLFRKRDHKETLTEEETAFLSETSESIFRQVFYRNSLMELTKCFDNETPFLNYLFDLSLENLLGRKIVEFAEMQAKEKPGKYKGIAGMTESMAPYLLDHKKVVAEKTIEFCNYNDVNKTDPVAVANREKIIRKYIWLLRYHNAICEAKKFPLGLFPHKIGYDPNVLRIVVRVEP